MRRVRATIVAEENYKHYIFWVCVSSLRYPACNAHAPYCHLWSVPLHKTLPPYLINGTIFFKKKLLKTKCVFWFSLQLLSQTFLILRREMSEIWSKMYVGLHVKCPLFFSDFNETWIFSTAFRIIFKYQISRKSKQWDPRCSMRTDKRTHWHTWRS
jgi:hypothetical protein